MQWLLLLKRIVEKVDVIVLQVEEECKLNQYRLPIYLVTQFISGSDYSTLDCEICGAISQI